MMQQRECSMDTPVKYVAELSHVREVSLLGTANLAYWRDRLATESLTPADQDGNAQLLIVAAEMRFMGIRFRELSFSVVVSRQDGAAAREGMAGGAYLVRAFNSRRFFAFCERAFFSTPYCHGDVRVATALPASIRLIQGGEAVFAAEMREDPSAPPREPPREPSRIGEDGWEGPVFLPARGRTNDARGKWFFAKIQGQTHTYPFVHPADCLTIKPGRDGGILQALLDSQFTGTQWSIRQDATHAKSRTYPRTSETAARDGG